MRETRLIVCYPLELEGKTIKAYMLVMPGMWAIDQEVISAFTGGNIIVQQRPLVLRAATRNQLLIFREQYEGHLCLEWDVVALGDFVPGTQSYACITRDMEDAPPISSSSGGRFNAQNTAFLAFENTAVPEG